jgi:hypothetical protein
MIECYSWQTAAAVRFTLLPSGIVNYSLVSIGCPCLSYFLPMWAFYGMYNALTNLIGCNLTSFAELLDSDGWSSLSTGEKIEYVLIFCSLIFGITVLIIIHQKASKQMKKIKASLALKEKEKESDPEENVPLNPETTNEAPVLNEPEPIEETDKKE